ncbi:MAG: hypothetical protein JOZ92_09090, partial [Candidatus Dormibacteraeota bacterium]|nr:hypothetical protein [Candidatus Dormibacteraeota bacterium]
MAVSLAALAPVATLLVLLEVAAGTVAAAYLVDWTGRVGRGFVGTTALICAAVMGVDILIGANVPSDTTLVHGALPAQPLSGLVHWCVWFAVSLLGFALFCWIGTDAARRVVGALTIAVGGAALGMAAAAFGPAVGGGSVAALAFVPAALVGGSALAGMLLGHWYLVAPSLSFRPLRQVIRLVFA